MILSCLLIQNTSLHVYSKKKTVYSKSTSPCLPDFIDFLANLAVFARKIFFFNSALKNNDFIVFSGSKYVDLCVFEKKIQDFSWVLSQVKDYTCFLRVNQMGNLRCFEAR